MSQPTAFNIPEVGPESPVSMASFINASFDALLTGHIGPTRPSYIKKGTIWLQETSSPSEITAYLYDGINDIEIGTFDVSGNTFTPSGAGTVYFANTGVSSGNVPLVNQSVTSTASAGTVTLGTTLEHSITGTTTITAFNGVSGVRYKCRSAGAFTLTYHASNLILPTAANITTASGDTFEVYMLTGSTCFVTNYQRASGKSLAGDTGGVVQVVTTQDSAVATGTTIIPYDDTIPQNTEGDEYMTLAITPTSSSNKLVIMVEWNGSSTSSSQFTLALFQDSAANAIAASQNVFDGGNDAQQLTLSHTMIAGTTSETTFKVRAGSNTISATTTFNGRTSGRIYGGVMASNIVIMEVSV